MKPHRSVSGIALVFALALAGCTSPGESTSSDDITTGGASRSPFTPGLYIGDGNVSLLVFEPDANLLDVQDAFFSWNRWQAPWWNERCGGEVDVPLLGGDSEVSNGQVKILVEGACVVEVHMRPEGDQIRVNGNIGSLNGLSNMAGLYHRPKAGVYASPTGGRVKVTPTAMGADYTLTTPSGKELEHGHVEIARPASPSAKDQPADLAFPNYAHTPCGASFHVFEMDGVQSLWVGGEACGEMGFVHDGTLLPLAH